MKRSALLFTAALVYFTAVARTDSGILIATDIGRPDDSVLSLDKMVVEAKIDNQHAYVTVTQVFASHVGRTLEGKYLFDLPPRATVADFAVWDGLVRLPAVVMEKARAEEVYAQIKSPRIDPGLLTQDDEQGTATAFNVKVAPIPGYGTKRLELEYTEMLPVDSLTVGFSFPCKPSGGRQQRVKEFSFRARVLNDLPIELIESSRRYPLKITTISDSEFVAEYSAQDVYLDEDLSFRYAIKVERSDVSFAAYRSPQRITAYDLRDPTRIDRQPEGYFQATVIYNLSGKSAVQRLAGTADSLPPRQIIVLLDTSLSMHGEKIIRAYEAVEAFLHKLRPQDTFNVILFNEVAKSFSVSAVAATAENVDAALSFVRETPLGNGTSIVAALRAAINQLKSDASIILITDANPTLDELSIKPIATEFEAAAAQRKLKLKLYAFGIGGDVQQTLLEELVKKCQGYYVQYRETEELSLALSLFFDKIGQSALNAPKFEASSNLYDVYYDSNAVVFDGSSFSIVGRYKNPATEQIKISGMYGGSKVDVTREILLPELDTTHDHLPRLWARARVDALLRKIDLEGERADLIEEIIRLSQKYKFVTPYTAFIAAPRSLLRPRIIQPGDPVIRIKADPSVVAITAVLPFGLVLPLTYLASEGVWQGRFLAPKNIPDGMYKCRLILTDRSGRGYEEEKNFVIDSHPPRLKAFVERSMLKPGEQLQIKVDADPDTALLTARFYGAQPVRLQWSPQEKLSVGSIRIPSDIPAGKYFLLVCAEDFAHNNSQVEIEVEIIGASL
ncbi:MAG: VIT domain-containing protein [Acidobacteriota bacterium]|nr:VIT domain-containing protein [Blastocatellia bacterium]MDW8411626.1 VIT domain-containing protein [Acidobacteriota bacterium]